MGAITKRSKVLGILVVLLVVLSFSACENREWGKAQKTSTVEGYNAFLQKYPSGKHAAEAKSAIEKLELQKAEKANTVEALEAFLAKYPNSKSATSVTDKIAALKAEAIAAKEKEATDNLAAIQTALENYKEKQKAAKKKALYIAAKPSPASGGTDATPDEWKDEGGFTDLGFAPAGPVLYQYAVTVDRSGTKYTATATGDIDENGTKVVFKITSENPTPVISPEGEH